MTQTRKKRLLWALCLAALALFAAAMVWLHYQQLCATGRGEDPYTSDLGQHLHFAQSGLIYSATSLLIGPAYAAGGKLGFSADETHPDDAAEKAFRDSVKRSVNEQLKAEPPKQASPSAGQDYLARMRQTMGLK